MEPGWRQLWGCPYLGDGLIAPCWQGALPCSLPQRKIRSFPQHFYPLLLCKNGPREWGGGEGWCDVPPQVCFHPAGRLAASARRFRGQIVFILERKPMCDVRACVRAAACFSCRGRHVRSQPPSSHVCLGLSRSSAKRKSSARKAGLKKKKNRLFSSTQALPVAIYTLLQGYLCPLPTAGWGKFLDLVFLVAQGYSPAVQGRVHLMPGLRSPRCLSLMVV